MNIARYYDSIISVGLIIFSVGVYFLTLSPTVNFGDSGELIAVAKTLGIAHPPGYPLFTLLAHIFTKIPLFDTAFRVNFFSAATSSMAVAVFFLSLRLLKLSRFVASISALILATSYLFWLYALIAEVFALHHLLLLLVIYFTLKLIENPISKNLYFLSGIYGLSLTNHHLVVFLIPALILVLIYVRHTLNQRSLIFSAIIFLFGFSPYLYLPLRASQNPILNWGDPDNFERFINVLTRSDYGTFTLSASDGGISFPGIAFYFKELWSNFAGLGLLGVIGSVALYKKSGKTFWFISLGFIFLGLVFTALTDTVSIGLIHYATIEKFFAASQILFMFFLAFGISQICIWLTKIQPNFKFLILGLPLITLVFNFPRVNQKQNFVYQNYGELLLATLPENSVVLTVSDKISMYVKYAQEVTNKRNDIKLILYTFLNDKWYLDNLQRKHPQFEFPYSKFSPDTPLTEPQIAKIICSEIASKYPTFIEKASSGLSKENTPDCSYTPNKFMLQMQNPPLQISSDYLAGQLNDFWLPLQKSLQQNIQTDLKTQVVNYAYAESLTLLGQQIYLMNKLPKARQAYELANQISPDYGPSYHMLALIYKDMSDYDQAIDLEKKAIGAEPKYSPSYKNLGLLYYNYKKDPQTALMYLRTFTELSRSPEEKKEFMILIRQIESKL